MALTKKTFFTKTIRKCNTCALSVACGHCGLISVSFRITALYGHCVLISVSCRITALYGHCGLISVSFRITALYGHCGLISVSFRITALAFFLHLFTPIDFRSFTVQSNHLNFSPPVCITTFTRPKYWTLV